LIPQRRYLILAKEEYNAISSFVIENDTSKHDFTDILFINSNEISNENSHYIQSPQLSGSIIILRVKSVDFTFCRYTGESELLLNGLPISNQRIYLFANGSVLKQPKGKPIFYTDIAAKFLSDSSAINVSFSAEQSWADISQWSCGIKGYQHRRAIRQNGCHYGG
jgi:ABC transport system ATP-binding/permease protein